MNESDIEAEYPLDIDDENVSERGFQSTLPGESTRVSSALALFRVARILSKVLDEVYPSTSSHELSLQKIGALNDELGVWLQSLAPHHRLQFVQDKPSTNVVGSRSPLLVMCLIFTQKFPTLTISTVSRISLHSNADSSTSLRLQSWCKSICFARCRRKFEQAYRPDCTTTRRAPYELLILLEQE